MYFKENWQSMAEKEPPFGHVDIFKTSPSCANTYHGAAIRFHAEKYINAWYYWAKYGSLFVYTGLVNDESGPLLYELNTHAEFAHYTLGVGSGVSFPAGIDISFSGVKDVIGVRNLRIKA